MSFTHCFEIFLPPFPLPTLGFLLAVVISGATILFLRFLVTGGDVTGLEGCDKDKVTVLEGCDKDKVTGLPGGDKVIGLASGDNAG